MAKSTDTIIVSEYEPAPICKTCGHTHLTHFHRPDSPVCLSCPDQTCQDGPDGQRLRMIEAAAAGNDDEPPR